MLRLPFVVEKSIIIDKDVTDIFKAIADFNTWREWSPWLCQEKACAVMITGKVGHKGHAQTWDGRIIGSGSMSLEEVKAEKSLSYTLKFLKPWKSTSIVNFEFEKVDQGTKLTWSMHGSLPIFLFFIKNMMQALVGSDYERGLLMLKDYLETGEVLTDSEYYSVSSKKAFVYLGTTRKCAIEAMPRLMQEDLEYLDNKVKAGELAVPQKIMTLYHIFDLEKDYVEYTSAYTYKSLPEKNANLPSGYIKSHKVLQVNHKGSYKHLGNAWSTLMSYQRASRKKKLRSIPIYEIYKTVPGEVDEKDILTEVYMPIR